MSGKRLLMQKIIIALDGFSGTGKSSTAKAVARELGYLYIDSGAMYRAATLFFIQQHIDLNDESEVTNALQRMQISFNGNHISLNKQDVSAAIRTMQVNEKVSAVSAVASVRRALVAQQQQIGAARGIVMDGRDIGTVVFPDAELKLFMTASSGIRARRRQLELEQKGIHESLEAIEQNLLERDRLDSSREESPLRKANGAIEMDTTDLSFDEQVFKIVSMAKAIIHAN